MSPITAPQEIQHQIFGLLSCADLVRLSETCRQLTDYAARDPTLCRRLTRTYRRIKENTPGMFGSRQPVLRAQRALYHPGRHRNSKVHICR